VRIEEYVRELSGLDGQTQEAVSDLEAVARCEHQALGMGGFGAGFRLDAFLWFLRMPVAALMAQSL